VSEGKSTFFVEMEEVARMCHEATPESFVILDELGRGTSTYDGIALAQSVLEYVYSQIQPFLLCATHYHEVAHALTKGGGSAIGAYHAATARTTTGVVLLHTICRGIAEGSFGIAVARTAGIPDLILRRAELVLHELVHNKNLSQHSESDAPRVSLCIVPEHIRYVALAEQIGRLSLDDITPRQALALLHEFVARITPSQ
jgi:DNA mismatch repair protein MutS